ncbi:MAG: nitrate reductase molybdenum cofactor assembly chaperone [Thermoleophilia bacterium]
MSPVVASLDILAEALRYPSPRSLDTLRRRLEEVALDSVRAELEAFVTEIEHISLESWEELYVRSFDLDPDAAPYLGWQVWRDEQRRAELLVEMARRLSERGVDLEGELPDHLVPVLRYLATSPDAAVDQTPLLDQALAPALAAIIRSLRSSAEDNPYVHVLEGVAKALGLPEEGRST